MVHVGLPSRGFSVLLYAHLPLGEFCKWKNILYYNSLVSRLYLNTWFISFPKFLPLHFEIICTNLHVLILERKKKPFSIQKLGIFWEFLCCFDIRITKRILKQNLCQRLQINYVVKTFCRSSANDIVMVTCMLSRAVNKIWSRQLVREE